MELSNERAPFVFTPAASLLPREIVRQLSRDALHLYASVWNRMAFLERDELITVNSDTARRAKMHVDTLLSAQMELDALGLLDIEYDTRPGFVAEAMRTVYRFPAQEAETNPH